MLRLIIGAVAMAEAGAASCASTDLIGPWCQAANGTLTVTDQRAACVKDGTGTSIMVV